eukprot:604149-Pyramimonas_sp.AAC.1
MMSLPKSTFFEGCLGPSGSLFRSKIKTTTLRASHFVENVPSEMQMFCRVLRSGPPCCRSFSEDVPSEIAILNIRVS